MYVVLNGRFTINLNHGTFSHTGIIPIRIDENDMVPFERAGVQQAVCVCESVRGCFEARKVGFRQTWHLAKAHKLQWVPKLGPHNGLNTQNTSHLPKWGMNTWILYVCLNFTREGKQQFRTLAPTWIYVKKYKKLHVNVKSSRYY